MTTARDIISQSLYEIGEYDPSNPITDADAEQGLRVLNDILDTWSNENLACFANLTQSVPLVVNKTRYSIGPFNTCDIVGTRPLKIVQSYLTDTNNNNYQIQLLTWYEWNQITNKEINGQVPSALWYDPQDPIGFLNVWPTPILNWTLSVVTYTQLAEFPGLATPVILPRGYVPALRANLSVALAPFFGLQANPVTVELASRYLGNVKRTNLKDLAAVYDDAIVSRSNSSYNIFIDGFSGSRGSAGG